MMLINEIFKSISGEAARAGYPVIFIRTFGCNLRCSYCDSMYAVEGEDYRLMTPQQVLESCFDIGLKKVVLTGGEPLLQKDMPKLVDLLCDNDFEVEIETNGSVSIAEFDAELCTKKKHNLSYTVDYKTGTSGMEHKMLESNVVSLTNRDVLKFVVGSIDDLEKMRQIVTSYDIRGQIFVSPVFAQIEPKEIVEYILKNNLQQCRFQLQIHKFVWHPEEKGV